MRPWAIEKAIYLWFYGFINLKLSVCCFQLAWSSTMLIHCGLLSSGLSVLTNKKKDIFLNRCKKELKRLSNYVQLVLRVCVGILCCWLSLYCWPSTFCFQEACKLLSSVAQGFEKYLERIFQRSDEFQCASFWVGGRTGLGLRPGSSISTFLVLLLLFSPRWIHFSSSLFYRNCYSI